MAEKQLKETDFTDSCQENCPHLKDNRLDVILETLIQMAGQDFNARIPLSDKRDEVDAISLAVNMLGEEMRAAMAEIEKSREKVVQSAKLASLGEMASGLSHELNNPLFLLMGFNELVIDILKNDFPEAFQAVEENLSEVENSGNRIRKIINHMREFSRQSRHEKTRVELNEVVQRSFTLLQEQLMLKEIETQLHLSQIPIEVNVDKIQMEQVLVNLISNARDAIEARKEKRGGLISVTTVIDEGMARLDFQDDGCGMDADTKSKVFDAFFTTKDVGKGTGLGMSVSFGILQTFDATIECESTLGQGTTFSIQLPLAK